MVVILSSGIRISIERLSFVPRLAEHGSGTCKTVWNDSRIHESDLISKGKWVFGFHLEYQFEGAYLFAVRRGFYLVSYISVAIW